MDKHTWESSIARILTIVVAVIVFAYLPYDVLVRKTEPTSLHLWLLLIVVALLLANMASRLKIFNFLDFSTKMNELREDTDKKLHAFSQEISTKLVQSIQPVQHQTATFMDSSSLKLILEELLKQNRASSVSHVDIGDKDNTQFTREVFLRKADSLRTYAKTLLQIARMFQKSAIEHEVPLPKGRRSTVDLTTDEGIIETTERFLKDGLKVLFPFEIPRGKSGDQAGKIIESTQENLSVLKSLLELRRKIDKKEASLPPKEEADELFNKVEDALDNLRVAIVLFGSIAIVGHYKATTFISELRDHLRSELIESNTDET